MWYVQYVQGGGSAPGHHNQEARCAALRCAGGVLATVLRMMGADARNQLSGAPLLLLLMLSCGALHPLAGCAAATYISLSSQVGTLVIHSSIRNNGYACAQRRPWGAWMVGAW